MNKLTRTQGIVSWIAQIVIAAILIQTLFFKFNGAEESIYIFSRLGLEPWGRIGSGVGELVASLMLLVPGLAATGALLAFGIIAGAITSHLAILGVEVMGDGGQLFAMAIVVLIASIVVLFLRLPQLPILGKRFFRKDFDAKERE